MAIIKRLPEEPCLWPPDLMRAAMIAYLERERCAAENEIAQLQARYGVGTAAELEAAIERGEVESQPAWGALMEWRRIETHLLRLAHWREALGLPSDSDHLE
jgi:hypothetical protein